MTKRAKMSNRHKERLKKIKASAPTDLRWDVEMSIEASEDGEKTPTFEMVAYNGGKLRVGGFNHPVIVELQTAEFEGTDQTYVNRHHDQKRELGHSTDRRILPNGIYFSGVFSHDNIDTKEIIVASKRGKKFKASIEASFPPARFVQRGQSAVVNGKRQLGPFYLARNAVITGVAILTRAADMDSNVQIAAEAKKMTKMNDELREFIEAAGFNVDEFEQDDPRLDFFKEQIKKDEPKEIAASEKTQDWSDMVSKSREVEAAETERVRDINRICAQFNDPEIELPSGDLVSLAAHGIRNGLGAKEVKLEAKLWDLENRSGHSVAIHDATKNDNDAQVIECSMAMNAGVTEADVERNRWYDEKTVNEAMSRRYRGFRVSRLAFQVMQAAGIYHPPGQLDDTYIENSVRAHHKLMAQGFTTLSLPKIMSNVANKTLLAAYTRQPSFIPFAFGQSSASDFKVMYSYQLEGSGMLEHMAPDGQIKHGKLVESEYTKKLETYSKMLAFTRQDMINDDLNALTRTSTMLGTMAFKAREYAATQTLVNSTMFSAPNGNLITSNDLSIDGLTASAAAFDAQTDADGLPISVDGPRILAPSSLKVVTAQLQNQLEIRDTDTGAGKQFINNPHAGSFLGFNTPWLDNSIATGGDANRSKTWYRFSDPSVTPAFEVVYLNGNDSPVIQSAESDFNTLGMQFRCYFDFGFGESDPRYAQKNVGA